MGRKYCTILAFLFAALSFSFLPGADTPPGDLIKKFYVSQFAMLVTNIGDLQKAVLNNAPQKKLQQLFVNARLSYKKIEFILEYYYELDVSKINGPPISFVEEEDPLAFQEPQGFQMIESYLYPTYDTVNKQELLGYINKLLKLTSGLNNNAPDFQPDEFLPDAAMEELYRVLALGITGFDSPAAHLSLVEARSSLESIGMIVKAYSNEMNAAGINDQQYALQLVTKAIAYLKANSNFNSFNRMAFITGYLNPLTAWLGNAKTKMGYTDKPVRYALIKKSSHLFAVNSLNRYRYLYDDTITAARIALGKKLFYEPGLSANGKRSCSSCHQPARGFTDGLARATELDEHTSLPRNTPTLWNAALQRNLFYDSRQVSLDHVITEVLANEKEMNIGASKVASTLSHRADYAAIYREAYPSSQNLEGGKIVNALSMYLRTIVSYNSPFDRYMRGQKNAMKPAEIRGFNLFTGKALCATCHFVPLFNGSKPPSYYYQESEVIGVPATTDTLHPVLDSDPGRFNTVNKAFLKHAFKTPTLRNITLTAPYMHNGVFNTLEEVVTFYNKGGGKGLGIELDNQTLPFEKLNLNPQEQADLVSFMKTLTDSSFLEFPGNK